MRVGLQDGGAGVRGGDRRVDRGAQVYGRTHRAGLIVGIHAASLRPACVSLVASGPKTAPRVARIQRRRRVAGPRWAVASSDNSRHSRICWNPGPSCLRLMFPWRRRRLPSMPKAGSTVRPMATSTIRRRGAGPGRACIPAGQWPAGTLARQGCLHGLRDRVRAGPEFSGAVAGMARRPGAQRGAARAGGRRPSLRSGGSGCAVGAPRARRWPAWRASWRPNGRCRCLACTGSNLTAGPSR